MRTLPARRSPWAAGVPASGLLACGLLALAAAFGTAQAQPASPAPVTAMEQVLTARAQVVAIDSTRRLLTLREGDAEFDVLVDEGIRRFDAIRVGDVLDVRYSLGVALTVQPGSGIRERSTAEARTEPPPPGQRPAGAGVLEETIVADILAIDRERARLQIRGTRGRIAWLQVMQDQVLAAARAGDQVVIRYRMAAALQVTPAPR